MIDTIKIISMIDKITYNKIKEMANIKKSFNNLTKEIHYEIITDSINGAYGSNINILIGNGKKYNLRNYYIQVERVIS